MPFTDDVDLQVQPAKTDAPQDKLPGTVDAYATPAYITSEEDYDAANGRTKHPPLFDWANLIWETEEEPPVFFDEDGNIADTPLLHLYTKTGFLLIGRWPEGEPIGRHFVSWAYLDENYDNCNPANMH